MIKIYNSLSRSSNAELKNEKAKTKGNSWIVSLIALFCMFFTGLSGFAQVSVTATAGTVGPTAYTTVKDAFDAINAGTHQGAITVSLSGNTTETATAVLNSGSIGPAAYTSVGITATTPVVISGSIATSVIKLNGADNVTFDGRIGGTGRNITVQNNGTGASSAAIWLASVVPGNGCTNNTIRNLIVACGANQSAGTTVTFGIIMCGTTISATADGVDNDNNTFTENNVIRSRYGITTRGTSTDLNQNISVTKNIVGPSSFGADEIGKDGIFMQFDNLSTVSGNTVQFVGGTTATTTAGADRIGIAIGVDAWSTSLPTLITGTNYTVTNNLIHDVVDERTFSAIGLLLGVTNGTSATNTLAANNMIFNVRSNGTAGDQTVGLCIGGGLGDTVANNSISLTGDVDPGSASATSMFGSGIRIGFASSTSHTNLTLVNNSVYMDLSSSSTSGARYYAISGNAAGYSFGTGRENFNNYYLNPSNTQLQTGGLGTSSGNTLTTQFATLANWQAAYTAPQDANSIQANPLYASTTSDLHIGSASSPNINTGTTVAAVTTDFDGQARPISSAYEIGADEWNGTFTDTIAPTISGLTISGNGCAIATRTVTALLEDISGIDDEFFDPKIYFRKNGGAYTSAIGTLTSGTLLSGTWTFTINYAALGGTTGGDVIDYFIVAQDVAGNVSGTPSTGLVLSDVNSVTTPPTTPLTYTIPLTLNGTYTVGTGGTFATLTAAATAYNTSCLGGPVVFSLINANYSTSETFPIVFNANPDASAANTLTIRPSSGNTVVVTGAVGTGGLLKLNGADYITIDGSNNATSTRNLTISNTTATTSGNAVVWIASAAASNGANNNTVKNTIIEGNSSTTTFMGLFIGGSTTISATAAGVERNNSNTVNNCLFRKTQYGLATFGFAAVSPDQNNAITNNNFGTATAGEGFNIAGIHTDRSENLLVSGNEVQNVKGTSTSAMFGIRLLDFKSGTCIKNNVHDVAYTGTSTAARVHGIGVASSTYTTVGNPSLALIANNFVSAITSSGPSATWVLTGMLASVGYGDRYYHNTVHLTGQLSNSTSGLAAAFANGDANTTGSCTNIDVRNNIFNLEGNNTATGGNFWAYYTTATTLSGSTLNNNLLRSAGTGTSLTNNTGRFNGVNYVTLANWQTGTGQDANSTGAQPVFVSNTDLHLNMGVTSTPIESGGVSAGVTGITSDIDGQVRPGPAGSVNGGAVAPDMGADEFDGVPPAIMVYTSATTEQITGSAYVGVPNQEIIRVKIVTTGLLSPLSLTSLTLNSVGTTSIADINATPARVYYTGSSTTFSTATLFGSATPTIANFNVTGSQTLGTGDNYFWLAYDVAPGATGGNAIDAQAVSLTVSAVAHTPTVTAPAGNKIIASPLSGTYTVGAGGNYASLTNAAGAFDELNIVGASGNVTFNIISDLTGELGTIALNQVTGGFTVLIKPSGAPRTITGSNAGGLIRFNGADGVTINGSTSGASAGACLIGGNAALRELTIQNTATTTSTAVIQIMSGANGAQGNTIKNVNVLGQDPLTSLAGITMGGAGVNSVGTDNDNNTVENCSIKRVAFGVFSSGASAANQNTATVITKNDLSATGGDRIRRTGIVVTNEDGDQITENSIGGISTVESADAVAIGVGGPDVSTTTGSGNVTNTLVANNKIDGVASLSTTGFSAVGISVAGGTTGANTVQNNMISGIMAPATSPDFPVGIFVAGNAGSNTRLYYNSISLTGERSFTGTSTSQVPGFGIAIIGTDPTLTIKNNIVVNTQTTTTGGTNAKSYAVGMISTTFTNLDSNYNDFWTDGANDGGFRTGSLGAAAGTSYATLALWSAAVSDDNNSLEANPVFVSASNLHLVPASNLAISNLGTPIAGITTDYDCTARSATTPDMGADEWSGSSIINLKLFIEGYYIPVTGLMRPVNMNQGVGASTTDVETITIELHNPTAPYAMAYTTTTMLKTNGDAVATFGTSPSGSYYIVIKTRNAIETWSGAPQTVGGTTTYDFSLAAVRAFGSNMVDLNDSGVYGLYSGDIDPSHDGNIDTIDYPVWETDSNNFESGPFHTDLNGDGNVDTIDYPIWENNSNNFISVVKP